MVKLKFKQRKGEDILSFSSRVLLDVFKIGKIEEQKDLLTFIEALLVKTLKTKDRDMYLLTMIRVLIQTQTSNQAYAERMMRLFVFLIGNAVGMYNKGGDSPEGIFSMFMCEVFSDRYLQYLAKEFQEMSLDGDDKN